MTYMTDVNDYVTGKVVKDTRLGFFLLKFVNLPLIGSSVRNWMIIGTKKFAPRTIDMEEASKLVQNSLKCALGERVCRVLNRKSELTQSVFLDELADGMVQAGKANYAPKNKAINTLRNYSKKHAMILSTVDKKPMEICCSSKETCIYWNMERNGLRCVNCTQSG
jgi:hypothetical protein